MLCFFTITSMWVHAWMFFLVKFDGKNAHFIILWECYLSFCAVCAYYALFSFVCLQLQGGYAVAMSECQSQDSVVLVNTQTQPADTCTSPENASCLEGSLHSSGSSGCTSGRTWGRTCIGRGRETERETNELVDEHPSAIVSTAWAAPTTDKIQIKQIKLQWQTRLIHYPTLIHQLFMTKAVFYVKTAPGYWVRCYLVYPSPSCCHSLP